MRCPPSGLNRATLTGVPGPGSRTISLQSLRLQTEIAPLESDVTKSLIDLLGHLTEEQVICKDLGDVDEGEMLKAPFFRLYSREV